MMILLFLFIYLFYGCARVPLAESIEQQHAETQVIFVIHAVHRPASAASLALRRRRPQRRCVCRHPLFYFIVVQIEIQTSLKHFCVRIKTFGFLL